MRFLVTGTAGFIGFHLARRLIADGHFVAGFDALTPYYDVKLKQDRHALLARSNRFTAHVERLENFDAVSRIAADERPEIIVHLAAQAGVRYSLENPRAYVDSNLIGTFNVLEVARVLKPRHLLLASTSSVYGANKEMPFAETDRADHPLTLYAATKKSTELMAHAYAHLWGIPTTAFRFFTVYGPWGRPDMALFKFVEAMLKDQPIDVYGRGDMARDFTYIDDLVEAIVRLVDAVPEPGTELSDGEVADSLSPAAPYRVVNIGAGAPVGLLPFIEAIERALGRKARRNMMEMQPGDVRRTFANCDLLEMLTGFRPATPIEEGVRAFVDWYRERYGS